MFTFIENKLSPEVYRQLREKTDFKKYKDCDVEIALKNNLYSVVAYSGEKAIGMARVVGDGRICFFLKDVVVDEEYQNLKVGSLLMDNVFKYIEGAACEEAYIGLMSTPNSVSFYEKYGFVQRPCEGMGPGMILFHSKGVRN